MLPMTKSRFSGRVTTFEIILAIGRRITWNRLVGQRFSVLCREGSGDGYESRFRPMIWDGKVLEILNVLRLAKAGKISVLYNAPEKKSLKIAPSSWEVFLSHCSDDLRSDLKARATPKSGRLQRRSIKLNFRHHEEQHSVRATTYLTLFRRGNSRTRSMLPLRRAILQSLSMRWVPMPDSTA